MKNHDSNAMYVCIVVESRSVPFVFDYSSSFEALKERLEWQLRSGHAMSHYAKNYKRVAVYIMCEGNPSPFGQGRWSSAEANSFEWNSVPYPYRNAG